MVSANKGHVPVNDSVDNKFYYAVMSVYFEVRNCIQCYAAAHDVYNNMIIYPQKVPHVR